MSLSSHPPPDPHTLWAGGIHISTVILLLCFFLVLWPHLCIYSEALELDILRTVILNFEFQRGMMRVKENPQKKMALAHPIWLLD